jgi:arylsulfatase A-like enzyme
MSVLQRFPRLNNLWVDLKHRVGHRLARRRASYDREFDVDQPRDVLLVVVDSLRADHVGGFGHDRPTTPTLDSFDAAAFPRAVAASPWTFPSIPSLLSGRYPHQHGGTFDEGPRDLSSEQFPRRPNPSIPMLPDLLSAAGYDTGLVTAIPMAERAVGDRFDSVSVRYEDAAGRVDDALAWLDGRDRWFLQVQLGDPHAPLDVPDRHRPTFDVPDVDGLEDWRFRETTDDPSFETYRDARLRAYDAAIRGADDELGRLLDAVDDETIVVVCGDHGEAFWEHVALERELNDDPRGYYGTDHGHSVFEELARVPLWIRAPTLPASVRRERVSLVDVFPTVLAALGATAPDCDGVDRHGDGAAEPILCEETAYGENQRAVWLDERKLISVPETGERRAFDLRSDPGERDPLAEIPRDLEDVLASFEGDVRGGDRMDVDDETRDRLSELGYIE